MAALNAASHLAAHAAAAERNAVAQRRSELLGKLEQAGLLEGKPAYFTTDQYLKACHILLHARLPRAEGQNLCTRLPACQLASGSHFHCDCKLKRVVLPSPLLPAPLQYHITGATSFIDSEEGSADAVVKAARKKRREEEKAAQAAEREHQQRVQRRGELEALMKAAGQPLNMDERSVWAYYYHGGFLLCCL